MTAKQQMRWSAGCARRSLAAAAMLVLPWLAQPATAQVPGAEAVLAELGFPASAVKSVMAGEFVTTSVKPTSERELTSAIAFLVKVPPKKLAEEIQGGLLISVDANVITQGVLTGSLSDFGALTLSPDGKSQAQLYRDASPGEKLNLSTAEIAAFRGLAAKPVAQLEDGVRKSLLARFQAYRTSGLDGVAPYARKGGKETAPGQDLRLASEASAAMKKHAPAFHSVLMDYPKSKPSELGEAFHWLSYRAHGTPVFILTHAFSLVQGDTVAVCQRQFYVSSGYNSEQAVAGFLPVKEGTVVAYVNRTSTDQVTGFGGSSKRAIGSRLMASQLQGLFAKAQKAAPR